MTGLGGLGGPGGPRLGSEGSEGCGSGGCRDGCCSEGCCWAGSDGCGHLVLLRACAELRALQLLLTNWCAINFAEAYTMMLHLKAIRVFVESVLRYGAHRAAPNVPPFYRPLPLSIART